MIHHDEVMKAAESALNAMSIVQLLTKMKMPNQLDFKFGILIISIFIFLLISYDMHKV